MMHRNGRSLTAVAAMGLVGLALTACGGSECPSPDLATRLAAARSGDVVSIAGCAPVRGHFVVPGGVTLAGPGTIEGDGATAVTLETGAGQTTTLREVTIVSATSGSGVIAGIEARGEGTAVLDAASVEARVGVAAALGAAHQEVRDCHFRGEVTATNASDTRWLAPRASSEATHGVIVSRGTLSLTASEIVGFPEIGLGLGAAQGTMTVGEVDATVTTTTFGHGLGVAISSSARTLALTDVRIEALETGVRGWPSYALLLVDGDVTSERLSIADADGFGIVEVAGSSSHRALAIDRTGDVGIWAGTDVSLTVSEGSHLTGTSFAAITAVDAAGLSVSDTTIDGVRVVRRVVGVRGAIDVGDGIDLVGTSPTLARVAITGAGRAGLVADRSTLAPERITETSVQAEGTSLGAVVGDIDRAGESFTAVSVPGWDQGITRLGTAAANDAAFTATLAVSVAAMPPSLGSALGVIAPMY